MKTCGAVLIGGQSSRMGRPKSLLKIGDRFLLEKIVSIAQEVAGDVALAGKALVPPSLIEQTRLEDVPGIAGPLAGVLAAFRWRPDARWIVLSCDLPFLTVAAVRWLINQACPEILAVLPHVDDPNLREPLLALYNPSARGVLEEGAQRGERSIARILEDQKILSPRVPPPLREAWRNVNSREEWEAALQRLKPLRKG